MRRSISVLLCGAMLSAGLASAAVAAEKISPAIAAAVADPARPDKDKARDASRKPDEMLAFARIKPGQKVLELLPGGAFYFTKIISKVVGPTGHVYAASPAPSPTAAADARPPATSLSTDPNYANVSDVVLPGGLASVGQVDVVWTAQNYHDFHLARLHMDVAALNKTIFNLVKPGGEFLIIDHSAVAGAGLDIPDKLHRIDEDIVKKEVTAAGFVFEAESDALRNPADPRDKLVFDASIRGHTDQFVLRFRKPK